MQYKSTYIFLFRMAPPPLVPDWLVSRSVGEMVVWPRPHYKLRHVVVPGYVSFQRRFFMDNYSFII